MCLFTSGYAKLCQSQSQYAFAKIYTRISNHANQSRTQSQHIYTGSILLPLCARLDVSMKNKNLPWHNESHALWTNQNLLLRSQ